MTSRRRTEDVARDAANKILRAAALRDPSLSLEACIEARQVLEQDVSYVLLTRLPFEEAEGREDEPAGIAMRTPCKKCGWKGGVVRRKSGQDVVTCGQCGAYAYCAPRAETGRGR